MDRLFYVLYNNLSFRSVEVTLFEIFTIYQTPVKKYRQKLG